METKGSSCQSENQGESFLEDREQLTFKGEGSFNFWHLVWSFEILLILTSVFFGETLKIKCCSWFLCACGCLGAKNLPNTSWTIFLDIMYVKQFYLKAKVGQEEREANDDLEQLRIKFSTAQLGKLVIPFFETHTFLLLEGNGANNQHYIPLTTTPSNISPAFVKRICRFF